jgi:hypothetical protein
MNIKCAIKKKGGYRSRWLFFVLLCGSIIILIKAKYYEDQVIRLRASLEKMSGYNNVFDKWLRMRETGKSLLTFFSENGYQRIAIYGMGKFADHLQNELADGPVEIAFGIDIMAEKKVFSLKTYSPDFFPQDVDAIIVTTNDFEKVKKHLEAITDIPVYALPDILVSIMGDKNV